MPHAAPPPVSPPAWEPPAGRPARILLVRLSALGDVLHALPTLAALKRWNPGCQVDWVVDGRFAPLLTGHPDLERVVAFPRAALVLRWGRLRSSSSAAAGFVRELRRGAYDLALDLQGNLKSGLVARASGAARVLGAAAGQTREANRLLLDRGLAVPARTIHKVERNLALLSRVLGTPMGYVAARLPLRAEEDAEAAVALAAQGLPERGFLVLHPGSSGFGAFKRYAPERFAALARALATPAAPAAVTYGPGEEALAQQVVDAADGAARAVGTSSLRVLAALLARAGRVVAGDTGPLHLAALLGTPVLGIYGPKDPAVYGPYGTRADGSTGLLPVVVQPDVACRPCRLRRCAAPLCLSTLAPERVLAALRSDR